MRFSNLNPWTQAFILIAVVAVVIWGGWMALEETLCTVKAEDLLLKRPIRGGCFEFWLNRYQSAWSGMIGAAAALFAAVMAWRAVHKQIGLAKEQSDEARRTNARFEAESLENAIRSLSEYERRARTYRVQFPRVLAEDGNYTLLRTARTTPHLEFSGLSIPTGVLSVTRLMELAQQIRALPMALSGAFHAVDGNTGASASALGDLARADQKCALLIGELEQVAAQLHSDREAMAARLNAVKSRML